VARKPATGRDTRARLSPVPALPHLATFGLAAGFPVKPAGTLPALHTRQRPPGLPVFVRLCGPMAYAGMIRNATNPDYVLTEDLVLHYIEL